jgi:hypothetical protein
VIRYIVRLPSHRGWAGSLQASVRRRLCDSVGRASAPSGGWIAAFPTIRTSGALMGSQRSSHSQGDRVTTLMATMLRRSKLTVGTLFLLALALGWDVQLAWCATSADVRLVELARSKFANLSPAELALLRFVGSNPPAVGGFATAGPSSDPADPTNDPAHADEWSKVREVRADLVRWLCVDPEAIRRIDPQGLRLLGAKIVGTLNLSTVRVPFSVVLRNCSLADTMNLTSTTIGYLDLSGSYTGAIDGPYIHVADYLGLGNGFHAAGHVNLGGGTIGRVTATAGHFRYSPTPEDALPLIKSAFDLSHAQIKNISMDAGFESRGAVLLLDANIGANLFCGAGRFINPGSVAIFARNAVVGGSVYLVGETQLIAGSAAPFEADGVVDFEFARVGGFFQVDGARLAGGDLYGRGLEVKGPFIWRRVSLVNGTLDLRNASVGVLMDQERGWPPPGQLLIDGLIYTSFDIQRSGEADNVAPDSDSPWDARTRLRWLARQPTVFHPQPYRQLAKVMRESGDEPGEIQVLIAEEDARYRQFGLLGRSAGAFLKATIGYGYRPLRTIGWSLLVVLFGWSVVWVAKRAGVMRATWPENTHSSSSEPEYEDLHPFLYSLDVFLPFVNLHQEHYWWPDSKTSGQCTLFGYPLRLSGSLVRYYLWLQVISGWLLSAILVAGLTGLMRSD